MIQKKETEMAEIFGTVKKRYLNINTKDTETLRNFKKIFFFFFFLEISNVKKIFDIEKILLYQ